MASPNCVGSIEDDGLVSINEHLIPSVPPKSLGEDGLFQIAPEADEVLDGVLMAHAHDILMNDGTFIEVGGDVVAGRPDDFDPARVGLMVGLCPHEGRQEAVVDVEDLIGKRSDHGRADDLHVAGEHDRVDALLFEQFDLGGLLLELVFLGDREVVEGDVEALGRRAEGVVVGHNEGNIHWQVTGLVTGEKVVETVVFLCYEKGDALPLAGEVEAHLHFMTTSHGLETGENLLFLQGEVF